MNIHQFNMQFNPEEDRILFRLNTVSREEFRFSLTRRFVKLLWPVLMQLLDHDIKKREPEKAHAAKEMLDFEREKVVSQTNFEKKYAEDAAMTFPLGEMPILLSRIQVKQGPHGNLLCLHTSQGKGLEFPVNNSFLHPFCKLLEDSTTRAQWELNLPVARPQNVNVQQQAPRVLH